ncbi:MAG: hypothetical protein PVH07_10715 [Chloroflexota bacterium]|jgi:hypothetical protein
MKKRLMVGLLAGGLLAAMLPGVVAAAKLPDPQANGIAGVCRGLGGTFEYEDATDSGPRYNSYRCNDVSRPIQDDSPRMESMKKLCFDVIQVRGGYDYAIFVIATPSGGNVSRFSCNVADYAS